MLPWFTTSLVRLVVVYLAVFLVGSAEKVVAQSATGITPGGKVAAFGPDDIISKPPFEYPYEDRRNYHQGKALCRVTVDPRTGMVRNVTVIKSTGWTSLDNAAVIALRQLRVKPGKWKQIDFPIAYQMARNREEAMEKMRRQAAKER